MSAALYRVVKLHVAGAKALVNPVTGARLEPVYFDGGEAVFELAAKSGEYALYKVER